MSKYSWLFEEWSKRRAAYRNPPLFLRKPMPDLRLRILWSQHIFVDGFQ
jgi:hypothetical protein